VISFAAVDFYPQ